METYHFRRPERHIEDPAEWMDIIQSQQYLSLALCKDNVPYLVTMNYAYDPEANCFYVHCAPRGKKMDYWAANPVVWGQVMEDRGYCVGECNHAYRSVQFRGRVVLLEDLEEKRQALHRLVERLEQDPETVKKQLITPRALQNVTVGRIQVEYMSGKKNPVKSA